LSVTGEIKFFSLFFYFSEKQVFIIENKIECLIWRANLGGMQPIGRFFDLL